MENSSCSRHLDNRALVYFSIKQILGAISGLKEMTHILIFSYDTIYRPKMSTQKMAICWKTQVENELACSKPLNFYVSYAVSCFDLRSQNGKKIIVFLFLIDIIKFYFKKYLLTLYCLIISKCGKKHTQKRHQNYSY